MEDGDGEEREDVDEISFHLSTRVDRYAVNPPPPQPQTAVTIMDVSMEVWWLV